jgi:hypothetical protein
VFRRRQLHSVFTVGGEGAEESGKIDARIGCQRRELCDKVQGLKDDMSRTISVWRFELVTYFAVGRQRQSLSDTAGREI